jgi:signal transduction histidine kinase
LLSALKAYGNSEQSGQWRIYSTANGFPDSSFRSITVSENGSILAVNATSSVVCEFDGYETKVIPLPADAGGRVYESPAGQLWACCSNGFKTRKDEAWQLLVLPELTAAIHNSPDHDIPLYPIRQDVVLCLLPDRLVEVNAERVSHIVTRTVRESSQSNIGKFTAMTVDGSDNLWIVGQSGLCRSDALLRGAGSRTSWREFVVPGSLRIRNLRNPQPNESGITLVADNVGGNGDMEVHFDGVNWETRPFNVTGIQNAWSGPNNTAWAASSNALYQWRDGSLSMVTNLSSRTYQDVVVDGRGTFWLATSAGLVRFAPSIWRGPEAGAMPDSFVQRVAMGGAPMDLAGELIGYDIDQKPWAIIDSATGQFRARPLGLLRNGQICFEFAPAGSPSGEPRLGTWDGRNFRALPFTEPDTADADAFSCVLETVTGDIWLGGAFGVAWLHNRWNVFPKSGNTMPHDVKHLVELPDGRIWSASRDRIWSFDGRNWTVVRSGLHPITAMISTRDGSVWLGQNQGVTRYFRGNWIENGVEDGLTGDAVTALCEDRRGGIWVMESNALARFHPEADSDPPRTVLHPISEWAKDVPENGALALKFGGEDKWRVTAPERLIYSQKLDDGDWSPFSARTSAMLSDLAPGRHSFQVRSMDRAGNVETNPAHLEFTVILPWYQEGRLVLIAAAGTIAALFFANLAYKRHRQLVLSYAEVEKQVAERSRQLEIANQELLQSQKMRALGTLSAGIAHDFNNILSIIKGSIQIIELNRDSPEKIGTWTSRVRTVVDQGSAVVQAMLGFTRSSDEALELCDVNPVVDNTIRLLGDQFLSEVQVKVESGLDLPRVRASQSLMQQILLNFIFNAAESMNERKRIVISTTWHGSLPVTMALQPGEADAYVSVSVRDFGCGISPENMARVFEPFFTTKALSVHPGTGLGLSIVYELAKKMRAGLSLESAIGQGSVFSLILPAGQSV